MKRTVISVENLYKEYKLGIINHGTLTHDFQSWWAKMRGKEDPNSLISVHHNIDAEKESFLALRDINLEIKEGERVGIIGRNGAGKSTLLKILSKITTPTKGCARISGRVGALLEVGTGFHPELTGRDNIYLNGAILGMSRKEINRKIDEIIDFSGIEKHIDTPEKRYSSGMKVRLGFAVAAHLEPEILIVDEVLAVGDIEFQKKALGKMDEVSNKEGRTILFVSHNLAAVTNLCNRGIVLDKGSMVFSGNTIDAVNKYCEDNRNQNDSLNDVASLKKNIKFISGRACDFKNKTLNSVNIEDDFFIEMEFMVGEDVKGIPVPNFHFKTVDGIYAFVVNAPDMTKLEPGIYKAACKVPGNLLNEGTYVIGLAVTEYLKTSHRVLFYEQNYLTLTVIDDLFKSKMRYGFGKAIPGIVRPQLNWKIIKRTERKK